MTCRECGNSIEADHRFCNHCGAAIIRESAESPELADPESTDLEQPDPQAAEPAAAEPEQPDPSPAKPAATEPEPGEPVTAEPAVAEPEQPDPSPAEPVTAELAATESVWSEEPPIPIPFARDADSELLTELVETAPDALEIAGATSLGDIRERPTEMFEQVMDERAPDETESRADDSTQLLPLIEDESGDWDHDPVWAATGSVPVQESAPAAARAIVTEDLPSTEPITEVWMDPVVDPNAEQAVPNTTPYDGEADNQSASAEVTSDVAAVGPPTTAEMPAVQFEPAQDRQRFTFTPVTLIGLAASIITLIAVFATVLSIASNERIVPTDETPEAFRTGTWIVDDFANNLSIAGLIAALMMASGGVAAGYGWRWGSGLAGGAGLALAGIGALVLGLAQIPIDAAREVALIPNEQQFTLTITRDLGYWMVIVAASLGVVLFFASISDAMTDWRPGLNPWIAAVGGLASLVAASGPLLPENLAVFSDNWYLVEGPGEAPAILLTTRLVQLGLLAVTGVAGFLMVRRYGLGLAIGGSVPAIWLAASTLFELTDNPVGPGFRNPGATDMHIHGVTTIGISAVAAMAVLAVIGAYDQGIRERR
jgi:hypothetical protein